jgi:hypothetical protein
MTVEKVAELARAYALSQWPTEGGDDESYVELPESAVRSIVERAWIAGYLARCASELPATAEHGAAP